MAKQKSFHEFMHDYYRQGKAKAPVNGLQWMGRSMLEKSKIFRNLDRAIVLRRLVDRQLVIGGHDEESSSERHELYRLLSECFDVLVDDLIIASSYELYAKHRLLNSGHVVHEIAAPRALSKEQKIRPIRAKTIKEHEARGEPVAFKETTLSLSVLLSPSYLANAKVTPAVLAGLHEVRDRRNMVHFHTHLAWDITPGLIALVGFLNAKLPTHAALEKRARRSNNSLQGRRPSRAAP